VVAACSRASADKALPDTSPSGGGAASSSSAEADPSYREVVVPAGTTLRLTLETGVSSDGSRAEDPVRARLARPIVVAGATAVPAGAEATSTVLSVRRSGKVKGRASLAFRFDRLHAGSETYTVHTTPISRVARATKGEDAKKIGIGTGVGAVVGAIAGGQKGAGIGAGAGTGVVLSTRGKEVRLARGTTVTTRLDQPMTVRLRVG
jgi:hypothetical protein